MPAPRPPRRRAGSRAKQPVGREAKDILLKYIADGLRGAFPAALGLDLPPIVAPLPAELPRLEVRAEQPDRLFRLADGNILHLEFQTTVADVDLRRFYRYQVATSEHYDAAVHTVVLYGPGITEAADTLDRGSAVYRVRRVFLGLQDGEAVVARLRERVATSTTLTAEERVRLMLLPLMRRQRPLMEVLREVAGLARSLPQAERDETMGAMVGLAYNYLEPVRHEVAFLRVVQRKGCTQTSAQMSVPTGPMRRWQRRGVKQGQKAQERLTIMQPQARGRPDG